MTQPKRILLFSLLCSIALHAQEPKAAYDFESVMLPGLTIGHTTFPPDTIIDSVALSDSGRYIFLARWRDQSRAHAAIFAPNRMVVAEGDTVDGTFIARFPPHARLAVNDEGSVAYEAYAAANRQEADQCLYHDSIYVEDHRVFTTESRLDAVPDFTLNEEGIVQVKGVANKPPAPSAPATPGAKPSQKKPGFVDLIHLVPPKVLKGFPLNLSPKGLLKDTQMAKPKQPGELAPASNAAQVSAACPLPAFPLPSLWSSKEDNAVVSQRYEAPVSGRVFVTDIPYMHGTYTQPERVVYFTADCLPVMVAISDASFADLGGTLVVYTAWGRVASISPDGGLMFPQGSGDLTAITDAFMKADGLVRINRHGQILVSMKRWNGRSAGLMLGTPIAH